MDHNHYMNQAILEAKKAFHINEVPIGAVLVHKDTIIARAHNLRETNKSPLSHAEVIAMESAAKILNTWNLSECTLYVTVEPCPMCAGAIIQSHLKTVVFGVKEPNSGSFGSLVDLSKVNYNHKPEIISGVLENECRELIQKFFKEKRKAMIKVRKLDNTNLKEYFKVRETVFVDEQNVSIDLEYDGYDKNDREDVWHVGAFINDELVGTMRLLHKGKTLVVGRLAVLKKNRKDGIGKELLKYAEKQAENNGFNLIELGAQVSAMPFYEKSGYQAYGELFLDANIEHKMMNKKIIKR